MSQQIKIEQKETPKPPQNTHIVTYPQKITQSIVTEIQMCVETTQPMSMKFDSNLRMAIQRWVFKSGNDPTRSLPVESVNAF